MIPVVARYMSAVGKKTVVSAIPVLGISSTYFLIVQDRNALIWYIQLQLPIKATEVLLDSWNKLS